VTTVWVALMIGLGVLFGMAALVTDLGYGMGQVRAMQNGADSGSIAGALLLAGSVAPAAGGGIVYIVDNGALHTKVSEFTGYNRPGGLQGATYQVAVEYRPCPGQSAPAGDATWTNQSDAGIVAEVGGTAQADTTLRVPSWTCAIRVFARVTHGALFSRTMGANSQLETGRATARIFPTAAPNPGNVWPITRWICNGIDDPATTNKDEGKTLNDVSGDTVNGSQDKCDDDDVVATGGLPCAQNPDPAAVLVPCTFWDSNSDPGGDFKHYVDFSRYSGLADAQGITRAQMLGGWQPSCAVTPYDCPGLQYDTNHQGNNDKINDVPYWIANGSSIGLDLVLTECHSLIPPANPTVSDPTVITDPAQCHNSRLETFNGDLGNNIADAMRTYIDNHLAGNDSSICHDEDGDPLVGADADYANVTVFFWRWGEQDTANNNDSIALTNQSRLWGYYGDSIPDQANDLKRVIVQRYTNFRFCRGLVEGSRVRGWFVSYVTSLTPGSGPPSPIANTVGLVE
jgi:Flp pilus assembly protein TadG